VLLIGALSLKEHRYRLVISIVFIVVAVLIEKRHATNAGTLATD